MVHDYRGGPGRPVVKSRCRASVTEDGRGAQVYQCSRSPSEGSEYCHQHGGSTKEEERIWVAYGGRWDEKGNVHVKTVGMVTTPKQLRLSGTDEELGYARTMDRRVLDEGTNAGGRHRRSYLGTSKKQALTRMLGRLMKDRENAQKELEKVDQMIKKAKEKIK